MEDIRLKIKEYYSKVTKEKEGKMETKICSCALDNMPKRILKIRELINEEIINHFYGCGSPIPLCLEGLTVVDLGCGTGLDVYILSKLVGENGKVIGVDMNEDQLAIANKYKDEMAKKFGYKTSNVTFKQGYIEDLKSLEIEDESVDVVVSNCVINLSPFKENVFSEIWRVLKNGGELYFSDIFSDRRIPKEIAQNPTLQGECIAGAMYIEDFRRLMRKVGWLDVRYMSSTTASIGNEKIEKLIENINFTSRTVRAMKIPEFIEDICEQYGQFATYRGNIEGAENYFDLDDHHRFFKDLPLSVCGNSCAMVEETRFKKYFDFYGDRSKHFGAFDCGGGKLDDKEKECSGGCCC